MNKCLLCQEFILKKQQFLAIVLLQKSNTFLCNTCRAQFRQISRYGCSSCCKEIQGTVCTDCHYWERQGIAVDHRALYHYNEKMADYFTQYKFQGDYCLRHIFAKEVGRILSDYKNYTVVPVPISQERYAERGFNQVTGILEAAGVTYQMILQKHHGKKQSEKTKLERLQTQQHFYISEEIRVPEKLILVDDIYTTGATIQLAKRLLMKNGAKIIKTFSIAR